MAETEREELAPLARAMKITGLAKSTIYRGVREKWFPAPVKVGRKSLWPLSRLHGFVASVIKQHEDGESGKQVGTE